MSRIIGLGFDVTEIDRVARMIDQYHERFTGRIFTDGEIAYCSGRRFPAMHFAGRFAAKEAAMKALGTGHSRGVLWRDIEVVRHGGPPRLQLHGGAFRRFASMGGGSSLVTITHTDTLAMAQVIITE
jgi:holo-[acyl-carrier protein] synthase